MQYRVNPKNGDRLSVLGYGCMRFTKKGGVVQQEKAEAEMKYAIEHGINYFDTAYRYRGNEVALWPRATAKTFLSPPNCRSFI
jgi:hypothetical protein